MPDWLRSSEPGIASPNVVGQMDAPASAVPPEPDQSAPTAADDPEDTSNFISEDDLPEWLRNLAAAEAQQAEEARRAAAAQPAEQGAASGGDRLTGPTTSNHLLDRSSAQSAPAGAWLSRREPRTSDDTARSVRREGHGSAFAEVVGAKPEMTATDPPPTSAAPIKEEVVVTHQHGSRSRQWTVRIAILVLAVVVLVLLLLNAGIVG